MYKQSSREIFKVLPAIVSAHLKDGGRLSAVDLGERYGVNHRTLNVNLQKLVHAGVLYSQTGGYSPGYGFTRDPKSVSLYDISQVVCRIEYPRCSLTEYTDGEKCKVCEIISSAVDIIISDLKSVSCYDFYISLKDKMKL